MLRIHFYCCSQFVYDIKQEHFLSNKLEYLLENSTGGQIPTGNLPVRPVIFHTIIRLRHILCHTIFIIFTLFKLTYPCPNLIL